MHSAFDKPRFLRLYSLGIYLFLFIPIAIVVLFSFNSVKSLQNFDGFSLQWYEEFFNDATLRESLFVSLEIALITMVCATVLGTALAIGLVRTRTRWSPAANVLMLVPLVTPEIVAGISALLIFSQIGIQLSFWTIVIAHITFSISYVTIVVRGRLASMGDEVEQAAMDLGATRFGAVRLVLLPELWPAVVAAGLLVFALSFDDFVTSVFTSGAGTSPLPVRIYSLLRVGVSPEINAVGTTMIAITLLIALALLPLTLWRRRTEPPSVPPAE